MQREIPSTYAVKHKNENVRENSRSGGVFTALSDYVLSQNGIIYGCLLNEKFEAVHIRATTKMERDLMRGSKYIQSRIGETYKEAKNDLLSGNLVLFSGTSCQISGLRSYLQKDFENLYCIDIVCHGVPSPLVWRRYLEWASNGRIISSVDFRNKKKFGWADHVETINFSNGDSIDSKVFTTLFYQHNILRPACYKCPYKNIMHPGDITIADYWGIDEAAPGFNDNKGASLVLINNDKGERLFDIIKADIVYEHTEVEKSMQSTMIAPYEMPESRDLFWKQFKSKKFQDIVKKYCMESKYLKVKRFIKRVIQRQ